MATKTLKREVTKGHSEVNTEWKEEVTITRTTVATTIETSNSKHLLSTAMCLEEKNHATGLDQIQDKLIIDGLTQMTDKKKSSIISMMYHHLGKGKVTVTGTI